MSESADLVSPESHFAFGKNWASYAKLVSEDEIEKAVAGLRRLAGGDLQAKRFLDLGCGSGLHSLAALRLGASEVVALDVDVDSVMTTRHILQLHAAGKPWRVLERSVFDLSEPALGSFDIVYSWGVLHHTGDMHRALRKAVEQLAPGGEFIFALYRRTRMCWFWRLEKRWYAHASSRLQRAARSSYVTLFRLAKGRQFASYVADYPSKNRGMDFHHDVHDWLGGWPYESISPAAVDELMRHLGLQPVRVFAYAGTPSGLFGSGCDEYVYARR